MSEQRTIRLFFMMALSAVLISASLTAVFTAQYYERQQFQALGDICRSIMEEEPEMMQTVLTAVKEYKDQFTEQSDENILLQYGYQQSDFFYAQNNTIYFLIAAGFMAGVLILLLAFWYRRGYYTARIRALTAYLEQVNTGDKGVLFLAEEDAFSILQDEIYKTVTALHQTRDAALKAKTKFAENLSNIAHQLKTPITALSLSTQMMKEHPLPEYPEQMQRQLYRLTHLEEALLLLSRIDAGTLSLKRRPIDVFTVLTLAADNLEELFSQKEIVVDIAEMGAVQILGDMEWMMEAVMNLLKNCMEHTPHGKGVHCSYEQNPLYVRILIWDEGTGFEKDDLPHLFERFYRGRNARGGGIGIGLSFAKELIEMQNGVVSAGNLADGGACFEIRMYSH